MLRFYVLVMIFWYFVNNIKVGMRRQIENQQGVERGLD